MGTLVSRLVDWWSHSASHALRGLIGPPDNKSDNSMSQEGQTFPTSVLVFTQNIARHPIAWDPTSQRPTQELVHAVHSALHFALDPCVDHPDEVISLGVADGTLVIPNRKDLKAREPPSQGWGVHVKLFIRVVPKDSAAYVQVFENALAELRKAVGATELESFVVSLQGIYWDGEKQDEGEESGDIGKLLDLWQAMSSRTELKEIGVSDFSVDHLKRLLALVDVKNSCGENSKKPATPLRRPTINQLNLSSSAAEPTALLELTQSEGIHLQTHSDDLGTTKQMVGLLSEFEDRLPLSPAFIDLRAQERYDEALPMEWVLKYTVFNRDRGLVGEKGYIVSAKLAA